jgi:hypothetical protein
MWTLILVNSYIRLHHSWILRGSALLAEMAAPKIYLAWKDGFYMNNSKIALGITVMYFLTCALLISNFRNTEYQDRLLNQLVTNYSL